MNKKFKRTKCIWNENLL